MTEHSRGSGRQRSRRRLDDREFRSADGSFGLVIGDVLMTKMKEICARAHPLETGGILIGCYNEGHDTALVSRLPSLQPTRRVAQRLSAGAPGDCRAC